MNGSPEGTSPGDAQIILPFAEKEETTNLSRRPEKASLAGLALKEQELPVDDTRSITDSKEISTHLRPSPGTTPTATSPPRRRRSHRNGDRGTFILHGPLPK